MQRGTASTHHPKVSLAKFGAGVTICWVFSRDDVVSATLTACLACLFAVFSDDNGCGSLLQRPHFFDAISLTSHALLLC